MDIKLVILLLCLTSISDALKGGIKVRLTKKGLDYVGAKLIEDLSHKLRSTNIPDINKRKKRTEYSVTNIKLNHFVNPTLVYQGKGGSSVMMSLTGIGLSGRSNWRYKFKKAWFRISDSGMVRIDVRGLNIQVHATMGVENLRPTIRTDAIHCSISSIKIKLRSKISWLYNIIIKLLRKKIKKIVEKQVKTELNKVINTSVKNSLQKFNLEAKVMDKLNLNYALTSAPIFAVNYVEASLAGTFLPTDTNSNAPAMVLNSERMLMVAISQTTFNNFANAAFVHNLLRYKYADNKNIKALLPASAQKEGTDLSFIVTVTAKEAPDFTIVKDQISCSIKARVLLDMNSDTGNTTLIDAEINVTPTFTLSVVGNLMKFQVLSMPFKITLVDNEVTVWDGDKLETSINKILQWLLPQINEEAKKGFKLPSLKKVALKNGQIRMHEGYVDVATDFSVI